LEKLLTNKMFKLNISQNGRAWKIENDSEAWVGKKIGDKVKGDEISQDLDGYEMEITGTSDKAGFPGKIDEEGNTLRRVLLTKGFSCWTEPKGLRKHPVKMADGLRLRKTVRGNTISRDTIQINMKVTKPGSKKLEEIFPDQNKPKEKAKPAQAPEAAA
jgi:small subunit ribosomal protein S6e